MRTRVFSNSEISGAVLAHDSIKTSTRVPLRLLHPALFVMVLGVVATAQVKVTAGDVKDTRRSDGFFNKLEVDLKISGESITGAKGIRVLVTRAVDETGKNLIDEKESENEFKEIDSSDEETKISIEMKNPERRANAVQEISGSVEIFAPQRDPKATIILVNIQRDIGKPIVSAALRAAGIELTVWNKVIFDARKKAEEDRLKKEIEATAKKAGRSGDPADAADLLGQGLMSIFGSLFSGFASMDENDLAFSVKDPQSRLVTVEFEDAAGKKLERGGRTTIGGDPRTIIYGFNEKVPSTTRVKLYVLTPRAVTKTPFKLTNVSLP
jgi:hypothetical protein